jgi:hypothetical protein
MLDNSIKRRAVQLLNYGILLGTVTWVLLIIKGALTLKAATGQMVHNVTFGPLTLMRISKQPVTDGFTVRFALEVGLIWYVVFWLAIGGLLGLCFAVYARKSLKI